MIIDTENYTPDYHSIFNCSVCGHIAGSVSLFLLPEKTVIVRYSFTGILKHIIGELEKIEIIRSSIINSDIHALYKYNFEVASFYCPDCDKCYCGSHWCYGDNYDGTWHDYIAGRCPEQHKRILED